MLAPVCGRASIACYPGFIGGDNSASSEEHEQHPGRPNRSGKKRCERMCEFSCEWIGFHRAQKRGPQQIILSADWIGLIRGLGRAGKASVVHCLAWLEWGLKCLDWVDARGVISLIRHK